MITEQDNGTDPDSTATSSIHSDDTPPRLIAAKVASLFVFAWSLNILSLKIHFEVAGQWLPWFFSFVFCIHWILFRARRPLQIRRMKVAVVNVVTIKHHLLRLINMLPLRHHHVPDIREQEIGIRRSGLCDWEDAQSIQRFSVLLQKLVLL